MRRKLSFLLALCLSLALAAPAFALQETRTIEVSYQGVSITLDDQEVVPTDAEGRSVEPFLYNGTTYLPVRGVANALALDVAWDGETNTVTLTSGGTPTAPIEAAKTTWATVQQTITYRDVSILLDGETLTPRDAAGNVVEPFLIDGTTYLPVRAICEALGLTVSWDAATSTVALTSGAAAPVQSETTPPAVVTEPVQDPEPSPAPVQTTGVYVGSIQSDKYHFPSCRHAKKILQENEIWFDSKEDAAAAGYSPCGVCKP